MSLTPVGVRTERMSSRIHGVLRVTLQLLAQCARARGDLPTHAWLSPRAIAQAQGFALDPTLERPGAEIDGGTLRYRWEADGSHDAAILRALARYELALVRRSPSPEVVDCLALAIYVPPALSPWGPLEAEGGGLHGSAQADVLFAVLGEKFSPHP